MLLGGELMLQLADLLARCLDLQVGGAQVCDELFDVALAFLGLLVSTYECRLLGIVVAGCCIQRAGVTCLFRCNHRTQLHLQRLFFRRESVWRLTEAIRQVTKLSHLHLHALVQGHDTLTLTERPHNPGHSGSVSRAKGWQPLVVLAVGAGTV